jgi:NADPH:quinone reductase-like Zn-dependent oxidoreductase
MKAIQFDEFGGTDVLREVDVKVPQPGPEQVRVQVRAAGVNALDGKIRSGALLAVFPTSLPVIPGFEVSGIVVRLLGDVPPLAEVRPRAAGDRLDRLRIVADEGRLGADALGPDPVRRAHPGEFQAVQSARHRGARDRPETARGLRERAAPARYRRVEVTATTEFDVGERQ